jgi:hypothetical protein
MAPSIADVGIKAEDIEMAVTRGVRMTGNWMTSVRVTRIDGRPIFLELELMVWVY